MRGRGSCTGAARFWRRASQSNLSFIFCAGLGSPQLKAGPTLGGAEEPSEAAAEGEGYAASTKASNKVSDILAADAGDEVHELQGLGHSARAARKAPSHQCICHRTISPFCLSFASHVYSRAGLCVPTLLVSRCASTRSHCWARPRRAISATRRMPASSS